MHFDIKVISVAHSQTYRLAITKNVKGAYEDVQVRPGNPYIYCLVNLRAVHGHMRRRTGTTRICSVHLGPVRPPGLSRFRRWGMPLHISCEWFGGYDC